MRNMLVLLLLFALVSLSGAQTHEYLNDRSVLNYNYNWDKVYMDTLHVKAGTDTLILTGSKSGYNGIVQPLDGDAYIKLDGAWSDWWKVIEGSPFSFAGGELDTLFVKTAETDSSVVQIMWTSFK
jgi:ABC-type oligopeptide transport system substrate-binding subunit